MLGREADEGKTIPRDKPLGRICPWSSRESCPAVAPSAQRLCCSVTDVSTAAPAFAANLEAVVVDVTDRDTVTVLDANKVQHKVRRHRRA